MPKIAFIASDKQLFLQGKAIVGELGLEDQVTMYFARLKRAVRLAAKLQNDTIDVIIVRGAAAELIAEQNIRIPVVEIKVTGEDLADIFQEAQSLSGFSNPKVAFIAFSNIAPDMEALSKVLGIDLTMYRPKNQDDIAVMVDIVAKSNYDVLVGGKRTIFLAQSRGLKSVLIRSGNLSIQTALLEAQKITLGRKIEKENAEKFKVLIDYSLEGIISINRDKTIQVFNSAAERLLQCSAAEYIGQKIETILDLPNLDNCLSAGQQSIGQILRHSQNWINLNIVPIIVDQKPIGAFITFQDISRIQEAEAKIRHEVLVRKFIAKYDLPDILGRSPQITEAKRIAREIAKVDVTTLIMGDTGTGKELFAQSIHNNSSRKKGPFVAINCAALPPNLLESELFGYVEGAFTGAIKKGKQGLFEMAHRGTLFLDEISEMDKYGQSRLLRVLQEKQVMRLGDDKYIPIDVRIIAATNQDLAELIAAKNFRQDLYYRLKVLVLNLPLLRKRCGDVEYLARHFLANYKERYNKQLELTPSAYNYLTNYPWPGNVRELTHFIERLTITASEPLVSAEILKKYFEEREYDTTSITAADCTDIAVAEDTRILAALEKSDYNLTLAARCLKISRSTLYRKLKLYSIQVKKIY
jgi:PAS domain S-box-containing protein